MSILRRTVTVAVIERHVLTYLLTYLQLGLLMRPENNEVATKAETR